MCLCIAIRLLLLRYLSLCTSSVCGHGIYDETLSRSRPCLSRFAARAPFFPVIGLFIKLDSRGPILYRCDRIGKDGKPFKMYKFRTMLATPPAYGAQYLYQKTICG